MDIDNNKIGDAGFIAVASCIEKIDRLIIGTRNDKKLSIDGVKYLLSAIDNRSNPVSKVKLFVCKFFKLFKQLCLGR